MGVRVPYSGLSSRIVAAGRSVAALFGLAWLPWGTLVRSGTLLAGLAVIGFVWARLSGNFSPGAFGALIAAHGPWGSWLFLALATIAVAVGAPRQAVAFGGAYFFGFWPGFALGLGSSIVSAGLDFWWARGVGRATLRRWIRGRVAKVDRFLATNPFKTTLILRLLPIGNNVLISLIAGISGMGAARFLLASALGYVPQTVVFALFGAGTRLDHRSELGVAIGLFLASVALGIALFRGHAGAPLALFPFGASRNPSGASAKVPDKRDGSNS